MNILSQKAVVDYQAAFKKVHGRDISHDEAQRQGLQLLRLFQLIYRPIPKLSKRNEEMSNRGMKTWKAY